MNVAQINFLKFWVRDNKTNTSHVTIFFVAIKTNIEWFKKFHKLFLIYFYFSVEFSRILISFKAFGLPLQIVGCWKGKTKKKKRPINSSPWKIYSSEPTPQGQFIFQLCTEIKTGEVEQVELSTRQGITLCQTHYKASFRNRFLEFKNFSRKNQIRQKKKKI